MIKKRNRLNLNTYSGGSFMTQLYYAVTINHDVWSMVTCYTPIDRDFSREYCIRDAFRHYDA